MSRRLLWAWAPAVAFALLIVVMSSIPASELGPEVIWGYDKLIHAAVYAVLAALLCRALLIGGRPGSPAAGAALAGAIAAGFGASGEWHQSFTPGRDSSAADLVADVVGAVLGAALTAVLYRRRARGS
ncbi:MAG TPA: VanZ family protein [Kofleriaceae bacterium]|nr:VanZ family protein [Kofleriaceae bacterium]